MLLASSAAFFILATPFLVFLKHHRYPLLQTEAAVCVLVFGAAAAAVGLLSRRWRFAEPVLLAGTVTLFIDVQFDVLNNGPELLAAFALLSGALVAARAHASRVLAAAGGTMLAATLLVPQPATSAAPAGRPTEGDRHLPFFLHIVLDGHIGIEGLEHASGGERLREDLRAFFARHRFRLFGGAYSEHFQTFRSLSHELNFSPARHRPELYAREGGAHMWMLTRNEYFRGLVKSGYRLRVYQSNFLDVCVEPAAPAASCETYDYTGVGELPSTPLTTLEKASVLFNVYLLRTHTLGELAFQYGKVRRSLLAAGIEAPVWRNSPGALSPLATMSVMRALARDIGNADRGTYIFAHLLVPHEPYLLDAGCHVLPPADWLNRNAAEAPYGGTNTSVSRQVRYGRYLEQVRCVYRQLEDLVGRIRADLKDDAIIIVQGDHGSRITIADPTLANASPLSGQDFADSYSTLFAVRAQGVPAGYEDTPVPLTCLLKAFAESGYRDMSGAAGCASPRVVFPSDGGDRVEARPFP